jgi:hypothetical protein
VEMASGSKNEVGVRVADHSLILGELVMKSDLYIMILEYYDVVINMDCLESHDVILKCKTKRLSWNNDEGKRRGIIGITQGVPMRFISSLQLQKIMHKGCKIYETLALN